MTTTLFAVCIVALQIFLVGTIIGYAVKAPVMHRIGQNASWIVRTVFLGATLGSLYFEYALGYPPCVLCWYQRIAIFSITVLLFTANIRRNSLLRLQVIVLSSIGIAVALLHNYIDIFPASGVDVCGATAASCLARYVYEFGYVTIPMMSLTVLLSGLILSLVVSRYPHE